MFTETAGLQHLTKRIGTFHSEFLSCSAGDFIHTHTHATTPAASICVYFENFEHMTDKLLKSDHLNAPANTL